MEAEEKRILNNSCKVIRIIRITVKETSGENDFMNKNELRRSQQGAAGCA